MSTVLFYLLPLCIGVALIITIGDFIAFCVHRERRSLHGLRSLCDATFLIIFPLLYLIGLDLPETNDCCTDSATFSPAHRVSVYVLIGAAVVSYFIARYRPALCPPLAEVLLNCGLLIGFVLNLLTGIQVDEELALLGNIPIGLLFAMVIVERQMLIRSEAQNVDPAHYGNVNLIAWRVLSLPAFKRFPVLILLCFPVLLVCSVIFLLFGQQPDSLIRAFTDTYKHGFSQLDHECLNVECGGHYLCSVAALGSPAIVRPIRYGSRRGARILCNRQLLVSNAFEAVVEEKMPWLHRPIRRQYNKVGNAIHRHYWLFEYRWISNTVYLLMKPAEWCFLLVLYLVDQKPENRIAQQYLPLKK